MTSFALALAWYAVLSAVTFGAFAMDKHAAARGAWRTKEKTLHSLSLAGGFPGALAGMKLLRHKTRKPEFWIVPWLAAALHVTAWVTLGGVPGF